jgi:hypothetical protein
MAASGFTPISLYYSTTAAAVPTSGNLANGELGLNIADMKLYAKNSAGTVTLLASSGGAAGTVSSVAVSGGTTGLTTSGGPITTSGTITLAGTLATTNGGTGLTSFTANGVVYASSSSALATGSALTFDGASTYLGIGTASPAQRLHIVSSGNAFARIDSGATSTAGILFNNGNGAFYYDGTSNYLRTDVNGSEATRLTSTGLGIGTTSPATKLDVSASSGINAIRVVNTSTDTTSYGAQAYFQINAGGNHIGGLKSTVRNLIGLSTPALYLTTAGSYPIAFGVGDSAQPSMVFDASSNLGLGVVPSAWGTASNFEQRLYTSINTWDDGSKAVFQSGNNYYQIGSTFYYKATTEASFFRQRGGAHSWHSAASGTAGNPITFTQAMTLTAAGGLVVGTTTDPGAGIIADANGNVRKVPQSGSSKTSSYTLATTDVGEYILLGASGAIVIPDATFSAGDVVSIFNNTGSTATITCSITTAYIAGTFTDKATMTLAAAGVATVLFITSTLCVVSGNVT